MNTRRQVIFSLAIVGAAAGSLGLYAALAEPRGAGGDTSAGHHHGAAPTTEEQQPVRLTADAARRIGVTYATAELRPLVQEIRAVGNVTYDETRLANVSPKIEGWAERLYVDFTGAPVRRGQPLLEIYSPMLVSAQEELILARRLLDQAGAGGSEQATATARDLLESARRRLLYWDVPAADLEQIEQTGTPRRTLTLIAPASGVVVAKNVVAGTRVMPGMDLYRIADLARVWIEVDVFEKDLSLVRLRQHGVVTFEAYPGEEFEGLVTYVYPILSVEARTGRVRLELANPGGRLKPGMYATVALHLASPRETLVVPRSAVLQTGQRALVFVRAEDGTLVPRAIRVGLASGNDLEIVTGLEPGEVVVSSASFLVDAESNLGAATGTAAEMNLGTWEAERGAARPAPAPRTAPASPPPAPAGETGHTGHQH